MSSNQPPTPTSTAAHLNHAGNAQLIVNDSHSSGAWIRADCQLYYKPCLNLLPNHSVAKQATLKYHFRKSLAEYLYRLHFKNHPTKLLSRENRVKYFFQNETNQFTDGFQFLIFGKKACKTFDGRYISNQLTTIWHKTIEVCLLI